MLTRNKRIKGRCLFPNPNASVLSQYGSIFTLLFFHYITRLILLKKRPQTFAEEVEKRGLTAEQIHEDPTILLEILDKSLQ